MRVALAIVLSLSFFSCQKWEKNWKHTESNYIGLKRKATVYDCQGHPIKTWEGRFRVETKDGIPSFIDDNNKEVKFNGTWVIEEQ